MTAEYAQHQKNAAKGQRERHVQAAFPVLIRMPRDKGHAYGCNHVGDGIQHADLKIRQCRAGRHG